MYGTTCKNLCLYVGYGNLSVLDCTFKKNRALQDDPSTFDGTGGGGAIHMPASNTNIDLLVISQQHHPRSVHSNSFKTMHRTGRLIVRMLLLGKGAIKQLFLGLFPPKMP